MKAQAATDHESFPCQYWQIMGRCWSNLVSFAANLVDHRPTFVDVAEFRLKHVDGIYGCPLRAPTHPSSISLLALDARRLESAFLLMGRSTNIPKVGTRSRIPPGSCHRWVSNQSNNLNSGAQVLVELGLGLPRRWAIQCAGCGRRSSTHRALLFACSLSSRGVRRFAAAGRDARLCLAQVLRSQRLCVSLRTLMLKHTKRPQWSFSRPNLGDFGPNVLENSRWNRMWSIPGPDREKMVKVAPTSVEHWSISAEVGQDSAESGATSTNVWQMSEELGPKVGQH